jgi:hypothetical protein
MKQMTRILKLAPTLLVKIVMIIVTACAHASPQSGAGAGELDRPSPAYTGSVDALFVGHSAMNQIVDDFVSTLASAYDSANNVRTTQVTNEDVSLVGKMDREELDPVFRADSHDFEIAVLTEQWDYESWYNPAEHGEDTYGPVHGCPPSDYSYSQAWVNVPAGQLCPGRADARH